MGKLILVGGRAVKFKGSPSTLVLPFHNAGGPTMLRFKETEARVLFLCVPKLRSVTLNVSITKHLTQLCLFCQITSG